MNDWRTRASRHTWHDPKGQDNDVVVETGTETVLRIGRRRAANQ